MLQVIKLQDTDIQSDDNSYQYIRLVLDGVSIFSTEEVGKLKNIVNHTSDDVSWLVDADRNSQELGELNQLRIKLKGQTITFEVQKMVNHEFEPSGAVSMQEFRQTLSQFRF